MVIYFGAMLNRKDRNTGIIGLIKQMEMPGCLSGPLLGLFILLEA